jgi:alkylated DNA repair dioxygenase AlkB
MKAGHGLCAVPGHPLLRMGPLLDEREAAALFDELLKTTPWKDGSFSVAGRTFRLPRLQAWYSDPGVIYQYADKIHNSHPWTPTLQALRERVFTASGATFNGVLLNLYRDGDDAVGWHADDEANLGPVIASLSLGATRTFSVRPRPAGEASPLPLAAGTLLVMDAPFQQEWQHAVLAEPEVREARLNLTFRTVIGASGAG